MTAEHHPGLAGRLANAFDLRGRVAVVTGAGSVAEGIGIGRAAAVLLAEAGAQVALIDRDPAAVDETRAMVQHRGDNAFTVLADVSDPASVQAAIEQVLDRTGRIDVLVNNVGIVGQDATAEGVDEAAWDAAMRINVTSMVSVSKRCIGPMRDQGGGSIINIASTAGLLGGYPSLLYPTSKSAIVGLTRAMAAHHGPDGIRVNAVAPGTLYTPRVAIRGMSQDMRDQRRRSSILQTEGTGWDAGFAVVYLASDAARWITGVILPVDAGATATMPLPSPPSSWTHDEGSTDS